MTGPEITTFATTLNGGASIDDTLLEQFVNIGRTLIEGERPWMVLRRTDTSLTASPSDTWQTAKSLAGITNFSRFYGEFPVRLFDGDNRVEHYKQVPWERRLDYKDIGNTFVYDASSNQIYLNGLVPFAGTIYLNYLEDSGDIDLATASNVWTRFPTRFSPLLGFYAVGVYKGAVDYDTINRDMLPTNQAALSALRDAMIRWDDELQLSAIEFNDPGEGYGYPRSGAINIYGN
jgi:hypothetical protein